MQRAETGHRADIVEAGSDVSQTRDARSDSRDQIGPERDRDGGGHGERQQIKQHEDLHVSEDVLGNDASAELHRQHTARMQDAFQFAQRQARHQQMSDDLGPAGSGSGAAAHEHQQEQHHLGLIAPELEVGARKPGRGEDGRDLEGGVANGVKRRETIANEERRDEQCGDENQPGVGAKLLVLSDCDLTAPYGSILQREVRSGSKHEHGDNPVDGWARIPGDRLRVR